MRPSKLTRNMRPRPGAAARWSALYEVLPQVLIRFGYGPDGAGTPRGH
ncbi:hypothetical protein ACFPH6_37580 [Streptomyces xiangluensis]|uniref:Uncharacterized protein n=1 Tax=Streptomyces xiangluensis TaxID=2665720 RepID=A0ABV8YZW1_9ACTN